jgi:hypothetical protein
VHRVHVDSVRTLVPVRARIHPTRRVVRRRRSLARVVTRRRILAKTKTDMLVE